MKSLIILGRQPALGLAELESFIDAKLINPIKPGAVLIDKEPSLIPFTRLGGSIKLARVIATLHTNNWREIDHYLVKTIPELIEFISGGKIRLGISVYNLNVRPREIGATGLRLKKVIKSAGRSVRIVPNKEPALNSAQVIHNQLNTDKGIELVLVKKGNSVILSQTISEQNIEEYSSRDQNRPMRDAKVGMLPPKLAQILINLATGEKDSDDSIIFNQKLTLRVLDPFCGTGVVLQESLLMGFEAYGTDIEQRMIDYSKGNLQWLLSDYTPYMQSKSSGLQPSSTYLLEAGDATKYKWQEFDAVACETFLGKPLTSLPPKNILDKIIEECDQIHKQFLNNIASQIKKGSRLALGVPAWKTKTGFLHLKTLDLLDELGYNRIKFVHAKDEELIYHRPDQTVARELVILEKK